RLRRRGGPRAGSPPRSREVNRPFLARLAPENGKGVQYSIPLIALMPSSYACLTLRISVTVSAISTSSGAASRPVITTLVLGERPVIPATTSSTGTHPYFTA